MKKVIRVKTKPSKINGGFIFDGEIQKFRPRKKDYVGTKEIECFIGEMFNVQSGDFLEVDSEERSSYHGKTLNRILTYKTILPVEQAELEKYLIKHFSGIGKVTANKMICDYGTNIFNAINNDCSILKAYSLPKDTIDGLELVAYAFCTIDRVVETLSKAGLAEYANIISDRFKQDDIKICQNCPYILFYERILTFEEADRLQASDGLPADDENRVNAAVIESLTIYANRLHGLYLTEPKLLEFVEACLNRSQLFDKVIVTNEMLKSSLDCLEQRGMIKTEAIEGERYVYLTKLFDAKKSFTFSVCRLMKHGKKNNYSCFDIEDYLDKHTAWLSEDQKMAVISSLIEPITLINGGAGSGKTKTINEIISAAKNLAGYEPTIVLVAPTGKAADRLRSVTGRDAMTIHSLIFRKETIWKNLKNADYLIVDEASMVDLQLAADLLCLVPETCRLIMVGDSNQLSPIEPGRPFLDLILSGKIPVITLRKNWRQSSNTIVENADRIIDSESTLQFNSEFSFIEASGSAVKYNTLTCLKDFEKMGYSLDSIQVISPKKMVENGAKEINSFLQEELNGNAALFEQDAGKHFFVGDRVVQTTNNYELDVYNGETGIVIDERLYPTNCIVVKYPEKTVIYDTKSMAELDLAYAITAHKAQGSEYRAVIMICTTETIKGFNRNLLYTAVTRAKERVVLIGSSSALDEAIKKCEPVVPGLSKFI